jgi:hypothetical protein
MPTKSDAVIAISDVVKLRGSEQTMIVDSFVNPASIPAKSPDYGPAGGAFQSMPVNVVKANCLWINAAGSPVEHAFDTRHLDLVEAAKEAPAPAPAPKTGTVDPVTGHVS